MQRHQRPKKPRSIDELNYKYHQQLVFLSRSCRIFDMEMEDEAPRLSVPLRALLHKTSKSHGLLDTLGIIDKLDFIDSGVRRDLLTTVMEKALGKPGEVVMPSISETGLVIPATNGTVGKFLAPLLRNRFIEQDIRFPAIVQTRKFDDWWNTPFIETFDGKLLSRADIVLTMANQDGGAHVDPDIDIDYSELCQDFYKISAASLPTNLQNITPNIAEASVRQIAFELMATIDDYSGTNWVQQTAYEISRPGWQPVPIPAAIIGTVAN